MKKWIVKIDGNRIVGAYTTIEEARSKAIRQSKRGFNVQVKEVETKNLKIESEESEE